MKQGHGGVGWGENQRGCVFRAFRRVTGNLVSILLLGLGFLWAHCCHNNIESKSL